MLNKLFNYNIFDSGTFSFSVGQLIGLLFILLVARLLWRLTKAKWRINFFNNNDVDQPNRRRFEKYLRQLIILVCTFFAIRLLNLDFELFNPNAENGDDGIILRYSIFIIALIVLVLAWLTEWFFSNILIHKYEKDRQEDKPSSNQESPDKVRASIIRLVQYIIVVLAAMSIIGKFGWNFDMFDYNIGKQAKSFRPNNILMTILIFLVAQVISWIVTQVALYGMFKRKGIAQGSQFAINQLLKYVIYTIATYIALENLGINMTLIIGGAAALLVGIGLGLQQTFNDFFSGLVLLFERSVSVGDVMNIGENIGTVTKIGLRSSIIETRDNVSVIIPNSQLVNDSVKNWTHFVDYVRFQVDVGVAYGTDTALVKQLLLQAAKGNKQVLNYPSPFVRFNDFGNSSLNFSILFFANRFMIIEDIKSDLRFRIDELFRENEITIPFPQTDVWLRKTE